MDICPACEVGQLVRFTDQQTYKVRGVSLTVHDLHFARCNHCGEVLVPYDEASRNDALIRDAASKIPENPMSTEDFPADTTFIEIRGVYDGWSVAELANGTFVNRWPRGHRLYDTVAKWIENRDKSKGQ